MRISDWSSDVCSSDLLTGWVTVANGGVTSFPNAQLNVIAGRLNKLYSPPLPRSTPGPLHLRCWPMDTTSTHPRWGLPPVEQGYGGMMADAAENIVVTRSEEHTSELQSLMRISYAVFCFKKKKQTQTKSRDK